MKKFVSMILVVVLLPFAVASAEKTKKVDAFVFFGLYVKRMLDYQTIYNVDVDLHVEGMNIPMTIDGETEVNTTAGSITFSASDYLVNEVWMEVYNSDDSYEQNNQKLIRACAAMSALEYTEHEENVMKLEYGAKLGGAPSAIQKMSSLFSSGLVTIISKAASMRQSTRSLVYFDNYKYYTAYYKPSSADVEIVYLIACAE